MNAGSDFKKAKRQAQANADASGQRRFLHLYNGVWWISKEAPKDQEATIVLPAAAKERIRALNDKLSSWAFGKRKER